MHKFTFTPAGIENVSIKLVNQTTGRELHPATNGFLGSFPHGTKITIVIKPECDHSCFTLNPQGLERVPKSREKDGSYQKHFTVDASTGTGQIARWPSNMVCFEIPGHTYNVGLANQNGRFFFVIEEYLPSPESLPEGMVVSFSLLRGIGTVAYKPGFDARIHWKAVPFDKKIGLRLMQTGDLLEWNQEDLVSLGGDTTFRFEIKKAVNLSQPK